MALKFYKAVHKDEIPSGEGRSIQIGERCVAVFNLDGEFYAIDDVCPHRGASLGRGRVLRGHIVSCPLHNWEFDVRTGQMHMAPGVESFPVELRGDEVWVKLRDV
jgi:nitrite reductase/ring-hydroxylating ferredoxin subunit